MPNPSGANQFHPSEVTNPWGDVKRQAELTKESPISGSPFAAHALETARRDKKQATRGQQAQPPAMQQAGPQAQVQPAASFQVAASWSKIAQVPGASDLVQMMAQRANQ